VSLWIGEGGRGGEGRAGQEESALMLKFYGAEVNNHQR